MRRMPPKKKETPKKSLVSQGTGMITGLTLWLQQDKFILVDQSPDGRFANDVTQWTAGLNGPSTKKPKDATK